MKVVALIQKDENGDFAICVPDIESKIVGSGDSVRQAKDNFLKSYQDIITSYQDAGKNLPTVLKNIEFDYKYDVPSLFNEFDFINVSHFAKRIGINPSLMRQYKSKSAYISEKQKKKIEKELHRFAKDILVASL